MRNMEPSPFTQAKHSFKEPAHSLRNKSGFYETGVPRKSLALPYSSNSGLSCDTFVMNGDFESIIVKDE